MAVAYANLCRLESFPQTSRSERKRRDRRAIQRPAESRSASEAPAFWPAVFLAGNADLRWQRAPAGSRSQHLASRRAFADRHRLGNAKL